MFNTKFKILLSDWSDIQNWIDSYELIRRGKLNLKVKVSVAAILQKLFFSKKDSIGQMIYFALCILFSYRKKFKYLQKKSLIFLEWSLWFSRMWEKKPNCNTYTYIYVKLFNQAGRQSINFILPNDRSCQNVS